MVATSSGYGQKSHEKGHRGERGYAAKNHDVLNGDQRSVKEYNERTGVIGP